MNIALSAVVIFILLIPPIAFYISYSFGRFQKAGPKFSLFDGVLISAVVSLFVHAIAISFIKKEIHLDILLKIVGGELRDIENKVPNQELTREVKEFALYNLCILLVSVGIGRLARWGIIRMDQDNGQNEFFRLHNRWWYLFNGYLNDVTSFDFVFVDVIVDTKDGTMIYSGVLKEFVCNGEELDRIYLEEAARREFKKKDEHRPEALINEPGIAQDIPGNILTLPYKNIINLNCRFIILEDNPDERR